MFCISAKISSSNIPRPRTFHITAMLLMSPNNTGSSAQQLMEMGLICISSSRKTFVLHWDGNQVNDGLKSGARWRQASSFAVLRLPPGGLKSCSVGVEIRWPTWLVKNISFLCLWDTVYFHLCSICCQFAQNKSRCCQDVRQAESLCLQCQSVCSSMTVLLIASFNLLIQIII